MVNFPTSLDSFSNPTGTTTQDQVGFLHADQHANTNDAIEALEAKVGTGASTPATATSLQGTGAGTSSWVKHARGRAYHNANQSIANNTWTSLALNSERYDNDTIHDTVTNNSRLTCKTAGLYVIDGGVFFNTNTTGLRGVRILLNGATVLKAVMLDANGGGAGNQYSISTQYELAVNDYVELQAFQTSGGALDLLSQANYSPEFAMARVG